MTRNRFRQVVADFTARRHKLMFEVKNQDYATDSDALVNFKRRATLLGLTPFQVACCDAAKHFDTIVQARSLLHEPLNERLVDLANYVDLLYGLWLEEQPPTTRDKP